MWQNQVCYYQPIQASTIETNVLYLFAGNCCKLLPCNNTTKLVQLLITLTACLTCWLRVLPVCIHYDHVVSSSGLSVIALVRTTLQQLALIMLRKMSESLMVHVLDYSYGILLDKIDLLN
jgi:hypothetical protein